MLRLPDSWLWDFWVVDDGEKYHLFFLFASRALSSPDARHYRASVGHAVSDDLVSWTRVADALVRSDAPAWDELATWTGSTVRGDDGLWYTFYTGAVLTPAGNVQRIGIATSPDLYTWTKLPGPVLRADPQWYEVLADGVWHDEAFRDPWVLRDPDGNGWHMLITARANHGETFERGVIGWAWSADLREWELRPPLTAPGGHGFGQLEVPQYLEFGDQKILIFNCLASDMNARRVSESVGGVWAARAAGPLGPYDFDDAQLVLDHHHYVGKVVRRRGTDDHVLLAFKYWDEDGQFVGELDDPMPVALVDGRLQLLGR